MAALFLSAACLLPVFSQGIARAAGETVPSYYLVIKDRDNKVVAEIPLSDGRFDHVYIHSIHLTPVVERFKVLPDAAGAPMLHLFELVYESYGVGMPSDTEDGFSLVDGKFILKMSRDYPVIPLMVSIVEGHGIVTNGKFHAFTEWAPQEALLFLSAKAAF